MKSYLIAALLLVPAVPALAQPEVAALREAALADHYAWDITEGLTTEGLIVRPG